MSYAKDGPAGDERRRSLLLNNSQAQDIDIYDRSVTDGLDWSDDNENYGGGSDCGDDWDEINDVEDDGANKYEDDWEDIEDAGEENEDEDERDGECGNGTDDPEDPDHYFYERDALEDEEKKDESGGEDESDIESGDN